MEDLAIGRLKEHEPIDGYYLAFSGGKDSVCIYDLAKKAGVNFEAYFHFTTVDPPELVRFVKENYQDVIWIKPKMSMFQLIERKGFPPTRQIRYCCERLKENGGTGKTVITGVRREESQSRSTRPIFHQDTRIKSKYFLNPIIDWKTKTVWDYIRQNNLKYCSLYDEGFDRIGCIMCPLQSSEQMEKEALRWPKFYKAYERAIARGIKRNMERGRIPRVSGLTAEDTMRWWIYAEKTACAEQCLLLG